MMKLPVSFGTKALLAKRYRLLLLGHLKVYRRSPSTKSPHFEFTSVLNLDGVS